MEFSVNNTFFKGKIDMNNISTIKSYNKDYIVDYNEKNLSQIINDEYETNDFIIIDRNVFNLDKNSLSGIDDKYFYLFDATEETKNINIHLIHNIYILKNYSLLYEFLNNNIQNFIFIFIYNLL